MMPSLLLAPDICFRATREDDGWHVVVGDSGRGYEMADGLRDWLAVEAWVWKQAKSLYAH